MERRPVLGIWNSPQNRQENLLLYLHPSPSETIFPGRGVCQYRENLSPAYEQERGMVPP
jgi:hypothetical protein